ncbi:hypothetical protein SLEP1_g16884 [Rubroshorea leprosula]|uniref:Uncharacterized protein n=1 Tax=Rubroshorea leprosula TaxID=152421 RepID=A0AAV5ISC0_9ROSI|nr:hypothetical protein SLEP1_g16884 [Rubroshorea leprosula]
MDTKCNYASDPSLPLDEFNGVGKQIIVQLTEDLYTHTCSNDKDGDNGDDNVKFHHNNHKNGIKEVFENSMITEKKLGAMFREDIVMAMPLIFVLFEEQKGDSAF